MENQTCTCPGWRSVLYIYPESKGPGTVEVNGVMKTGTQRIVKEKCHVCGSTNLHPMTFPNDVPLGLPLCPKRDTYHANNDECPPPANDCKGEWWKT